MRFFASAVLLVSLVSCAGRWSQLAVRGRLPHFDYENIPDPSPEVRERIQLVLEYLLDSRSPGLTIGPGDPKDDPPEFLNRAGTSAEDVAGGYLKAVGRPALPFVLAYIGEAKKRGRVYRLLFEYLGFCEDPAATPFLMKMIFEQMEVLGLDDLSGDVRSKIYDGDRKDERLLKELILVIDLLARHAVPYLMECVASEDTQVSRVAFQLIKASDHLQDDEELRPDLKHLLPGDELTGESRRVFVASWEEVLKELGWHPDLYRFAGEE